MWSLNFCMSLCMFIYYLLFPPSNVNSIVYTLMYVHIFGYLVNKLEIWWEYLSPIEISYILLHH